MISRIGWDPAKAASNWTKHGVRFEEAGTVFFDPLHLSVDDEAHAHNEDRFVAVGGSSGGNLLVVVYTIHVDEARIISARHATRAERRRYMEGDRIKDAAQEVEEMAAEYDFSHGVRGRHWIKPRGAISVTIDPVVAEYFPDEQSVNDGLRMLIVEGRVLRR